jgi:hypothetical protein
MEEILTNQKKNVNTNLHIQKKSTQH